MCGPEARGNNSTVQKKDTSYENYNKSKLEFGYTIMSILIEMIRMVKSMRGHVATKAAITWLAADQ